MKKRKALWIILIIIAAIIVFLFCQFTFLVKAQRVILNTYFIADNELIGADLSKYQGNVDMNRLSEQGLSFVYVKATEGSEIVDTHFKENWSNAIESPLEVGAYHFFSFDSDGSTQAEHFIDTVGDMQGCLIPVVDVEFYADKEANPPEKEDVVRELGEYLTILEDEYHVKPMIYAQKDIYRKYIKDDFSEYPRWVRSIYYPVFFEAGRDWVLWQYCDTMSLDGYDGDETNIDMNVLNKRTPLDSLIVK